MLGRFSRASPGKRKPDVPEDDRIRREPLPLDRAILWKPLPDSYHFLASMMRTLENQAQLFITQRAFLQVERHLRSAPELELGGFLAGHMCQCPRSGTRYSIVNTVVPFAEVSGDPLCGRVTREAHERVRNRLEAHRLTLMGWYRNASGLGLQLLPDDVETHLAYLNDPWQTTMLVLPDPSKPRGAFFTYDPRVGRSYSIPFYELFDSHAAESNRLGRTCVTWSTYVPSAPVNPLEAQDRHVVETTVTPIRTKPEPPPLEPLDEWLEAIKDPWIKLKDVTARTAQRHERRQPFAWERSNQPSDAAPNDVEPTVSPPLAQERRPLAEPDARPAARPIDSLPRVAIPKPSVNQSVHGVTTRAAPPFVGPAGTAPRLAQPAPGESAIGPVERHTSPAVDRVTSPAKPRLQPPRVIPPATAEAMRQAAASSAVALPPDFHDGAIRWQRRRRIGFTVAAASFLAVIVLSTVRARTSGSAQAPAANPPAAVTSTPLPSGLPIGDVIPALPAAVDSLSGALEFYRDVEEDHRGGLVGCRVLVRAHELVARARTRVESARAQLAGPLVAADSIRVAMLGAEYTHIAQTYQRSGCAG